uniref:Uncharacterized protein n=1 Tax=Lepeophtheirus salmonis TaxID=72036 RepID=A0A0K2SVV3_LEPSM
MMDNAKEFGTKATNQVGKLKPYLLEVYSLNKQATVMNLLCILK